MKLKLKQPDSAVGKVSLSLDVGFVINPDLLAPCGRPAPLAKRTGCAFPVTDVPPHAFCNALLDERECYCPEHKARMYQPRQRRRAGEAKAKTRMLHAVD